MLLWSDEERARNRDVSIRHAHLQNANITNVIHTHAGGDKSCQQSNQVHKLSSSRHSYPNHSILKKNADSRAG